MVRVITVSYIYSTKTVRCVYMILCLELVLPNLKMCKNGQPMGCHAQVSLGVFLKHDLYLDVKQKSATFQMGMSTLYKYNPRVVS